MVTTGLTPHCVCVFLCVCVRALHLVEDKSVNSPHTCCPSWIKLLSLFIHPATHVSFLSPSICPSIRLSIHPSIHLLLTRSWDWKIPTPLLLNTHGASVKLHLRILVTGRESVCVCVCARLLGIKNKQTLRALASPLYMWHLLKLI